MFHRPLIVHNFRGFKVRGVVQKMLFVTIYSITKH